MSKGGNYPHDEWNTADYRLSYVSLDDGELFAACHHCFGYLRIPWPERADEPEPGNHWRLM